MIRAAATCRLCCRALLRPTVVIQPTTTAGPMMRPPWSSRQGLRAIQRRFQSTESSGETNKGIGGTVKAGLAVIGILGIIHFTERYETETYGEPVSRVTILYRMLPLRIVSRLWGMLNEIELPGWLRGPILGTYAKVFSVNLAEAKHETVQEFRHLQDMFTRELKPGMRPINDAELVSPADGKVLYIGKVENGRIEQIKGMTYPMHVFLGEDMRNYKCKEGNELFHCVIYLSPGDYHRFHSPAEWQPVQRRHFPGDLLSVNPLVLHFVDGLFNFNERVALVGHWPHGFFSLTAVGATNVGSIVMCNDSDLVTNVGFRRSLPKVISKDMPDHKGFDKGSEVGMFKLGSSIALIFEAPKEFEFVVQPSHVVRVGQRIGQVENASSGGKSWYKIW
eukprot:Clim_evm39s128 gene=Clim_evmTU39s128